MPGRRHSAGACFGKRCRFAKGARRKLLLCLLLGAVLLTISGFLWVSRHGPAAVLAPGPELDQESPGYDVHASSEKAAAQGVDPDLARKELLPRPAGSAVNVPTPTRFARDSDKRSELPAVDAGLPGGESSIDDPARLALKSTTLPMKASRDEVSELPMVATTLPSVSKPRDRTVHVCFCSDEKDLRPLAAAIASIMERTSDPSRVLFHVVTSPEREPGMKKQFERALPKARIAMHANAKLQNQISSLIAFRKSSGSRKALQSPLNFAPFYLDTFLNVSSGRLVYLDTDVILQGDVVELYEVDLHGKAVGTVKDCSQRFETYFDIRQLKRLGMTISRKTCVFNRGIFVVDVAEWRKLHLTQEIERWMNLYKNSEKDLYKFGMSQPPWLLAVHGRYQPIGPEWNCRGLGREFIANGERQELQKQGLTDKDLQNLGMKKAGTHWRPFVAHCSQQARLLHFNGPLKPWQKTRPPPATIAPPEATAAPFEPAPPAKSSFCALPPDGHAKPAVVRWAGKTAFVECSMLWWEHLPVEVESELRESSNRNTTFKPQDS